MTVETIYRGHKIWWSDNADEWTCYDLSDKVRSSPKLSLIKAAIDRLYLAERKESAVECFELNYDGRRTKSSIVEFLGIKTHRKSFSNEITRIDHNVAVVAQRSGSERPSRRTTTLDQLIGTDPETQKAWDEYMKAFTIQKNAEIVTKAALESIPRLQPSDIAKLIELHDRDKDK